MKKLCIISPASYSLLTDMAGSGLSGGAEIQLVTLGLSFLEKGYSIDFLVNKQGAPCYEKTRGIGIYKVVIKHLGMSNIYLLSDMVRFMFALKSLNADVYLMKLPRHMLLPLGLFSVLFRKKVIFIGQTDTDADKSKIKQTDSRVASFMYRCGLLCTDVVVAQTEAQKNGFSRRFSGDIRVIKNILTMEKSRTGEKEGYILWVGNSSDNKQPELFLRLAESLPDYKFKMIMTVCSQRMEDDFVRNQLANLPNLEYMGAVPFSQMHDYYNKASLLVSTSVYEGFPNVFLQAWQFETPTISLNVDPDDVIKRFELGRLSNSFEQLVEDVKALQGDEELRVKMGYNAKNYALSHHSKDVVVNKYIELFNSLSC